VRKSVVIAVLALVIGVGILFVLLQPKQGSVEYHRARYFRARNAGAVEQWILGNDPCNLGMILARGKAERAERHLQALFDLRYVEERVFVVSNTVTAERANTFFTLHNIFTNEPFDFSRIRVIGTNTVTVIARPDEMPKWEAWIGKLDVPENGK
jgi:hypothetical protein